MKFTNEIWKDIKGYGGEYQVSSCGRIKSVERTIKVVDNTRQPYVKRVISRILKPVKDSTGYSVVSLGKHNKKTIHRLVAEAFIPNPNSKEQVNHINGNKLDNGVNNLEWTTQSENMLHRYRKLKTKCSNGASPKNVRCIETGEMFHNAMEASQIVGGDPCTIRRCANKEKYSKTLRQRLSSFAEPL